MPNINDLLSNAYQAPPPPPNPLTTIGQALGIQNAANQNRLFQSQLAAGQAFQQSIGPDGRPNQPLMNQILAQTPAAAPTALATSQAGQTLDQTTYNQHLQRMTWGAQGAAAIMAQNGGQAPLDQLKEYFDAAVAKGYMTPEQAAQSIAQYGTDPLKNSQIVVQTLAQNLSAQESMRASMAAPGSVNTGPSLQGTQTQPLLAPSAGAITTVGQPLPVGLVSPSEAAKPTIGPPGLGGAPTVISHGEFMTQRGLGPDGRPQPNAAFANASQNPNAPVPIAPMPTGLGPGVQKALGDTGGASSGTYQSYSDAATTAVQRKALLQNMQADATQFTPGAWADQRKAVRMALLRLGAGMGLSPVDQKSLAANESLDKAAAQLGNAQGAGSDYRLTINLAGNPSSHNSPAGLSLILNKLVGNEDYLIARGQLANQYQQSEDPTGVHAREFSARLNVTLDPRVFQFNRLDGAQKQQYLNELGAGKKAFKAQFVKTKALGVLPSD